jgi:hypothetical protein
MKSTQHNIERLNALLRGELAAVETYRQALKKVGRAPDAAELWEIAEDHREAVSSLRRHVAVAPSQSDSGAGAWGAFARVVEGAAQLFGNAAALQALREGEERGVGDYENALKDETLDAPSRALIGITLLPRTRNHIRTLDRLMTPR